MRLEEQSSFVPMQFYSNLVHFAKQAKGSELELSRKVTQRNLKSNNSLLDLQSIKIKREMNKLQI